VETIVLEQRGPVGIISLNRPQKMNALNKKVMAELAAAFDDYRREEGVRSVILTGGEKIFGAGADIDELGELSGVSGGHRFCSEAHRLFSDIENMPKPVIAAIAGFALGGCLELALACDVRIASEGAKLGLPEITLGLLPGGGGTQRLPRLVGPGWAKWMLFSGKPLDVAECHRIGLVQQVVPQGALLESALKVAEELASRPAVALATIKDLVNTGAGLDITTALRYEARGFGMLLDTGDFREGTGAFLEKRKPEFKHR
jgi:enoyl-CoA hydratase